VSSTTGRFVLFRTTLFLFEQPDEGIDRWRLGGDCAGWFYMRLLARKGIAPFLDPVMEDWGWTFAVLVDQVRVWVNFWSFYLQNCWCVGLEAPKRLFGPRRPEILCRAQAAVCENLDELLKEDPRIEKHQWYSENPFDLMVKDF
jgi:hypothetical protein